MTKEEIERLLHLPITQLAIECGNLDTLTRVLSIIYNQGLSTGREKTHRYYHQMFTGYNAVSIKN